MKNKKWYDYLWIVSVLYLILGLFNILFAWLGLLCFFIPLIISILKGNKLYCNKFCGRGQLFELLGNRFKLSMKRACPSFIRSNLFRYGFLIFFLTMFANMLLTTYLVLAEVKTLGEFITILWSFKIPWQVTYNGTISPWIVQFAFGFYSIMLTSTILGLITMIFFKPRTWCVYCPMGTMTQLICKIKANTKQ